MTISIDAIYFNHDASPALTIRKNQFDVVSVPEWRNGTTTRPEESPAAYISSDVGNKPLTIKAQFSRGLSDRTSVTVSAVARAGNVLGNVSPLPINFRGSSQTTTAIFKLEPPRPNPGVGVWNIAWDWFASGVSLGTTEHRIYTLASAPQPPWGQPGSTFVDFQLPWTEVLDHVCYHAARAKTVDEVADKLTNWLFSLGGSKLLYDETCGDSHFTINGMTTFTCTQFLRLLAAGRGARATVNCTDCATILSSFANILGCNLFQSRIGFNFRTNLIQKIGLSYPYRQPFSFHEVAWRFPSNGDAYVYDFCLQFDGDTDLTDNNFLPTLGINRPFGVPGHEGYRFRLIAPTAGTVATERYRTRVQRKIDGQTTSRAATDPEQQRLLAEEYDFDSWRGTSTVEPDKPELDHDEAVTSVQASLPQEQQPSDPRLLTNYTSNPERFSPSGWKLREVEHFEAKPDPLKLSAAIWTSTDCSAAELRVLTYESSSIPAARLFVLSLLGEFEIPSIKRRYNFIVNNEPVEIGDVAFADVDERVLLFARANIVLLIQNRGRTIVPVSNFAHEIDGDIASNPDRLKGQQITRPVPNLFVAQPLTVQQIPFQELDNPEEEIVMPNIPGTWSSILPTSDGRPVDLTVQGFIQLNPPDPAGQIRGRYVDLQTRTVEDVTGSVTYIAPNSFSLALEHSLGGGGTRRYEGQLTAMEEGQPGVQLVVGRYSDYQQTGTNPDSVRAQDGQDNGIWVATKP